MPRTFVWHPSRGPKQTAKNELTTVDQVARERGVEPSKLGYRSRAKSKETV